MKNWPSHGDQTAPPFREKKIKKARINGVKFYSQKKDSPTNNVRLRVYIFYYTCTRYGPVNFYSGYVGRSVDDILRVDNFNYSDMYTSPRTCTLCPSRRNCCCDRKRRSRRISVALCRHSVRGFGLRYGESVIGTRYSNAVGY